MILLKVRKKVRGERIPIQINLSLSLLMLHFWLLWGDIAIHYPAFCRALAVLTYFFLLSSGECIDPVVLTKSIYQICLTNSIPSSFNLTPSLPNVTTPDCLNRELRVDFIIPVTIRSAFPPPPRFVLVTHIVKLRTHTDINSM